MQQVLPLLGCLMLCCSLACSAQRQTFEDTYTGSGEDFFATDDDFACLADDAFVKVGHTRVANFLGHSDEAVALAKSGDKGDYPVGTLLQLFPEEASLKRGAGFSPSTNDWEFIKIDASSGKTVITERGTDKIGNPAGTCLSCHGPAKAHDLACFNSTACPDLPFFIDTDVDPTTDDPRCH